MKKFGLGTWSIVISIISTMLTFTTINDHSIGEYILASLGLSFPISIISLLLYIVSIYIGNKYKDHYFATAGKYISLIFFILIIMLIIINLLFAHFNPGLR